MWGYRSGRNGLERLDLGDRFRRAALRLEHVKGILQPQKITLRKTEEPAEAQIGIGRNAARAGNDGVNAVRRNADSMCKPILAEACQLQKLVLEDVARMRVLQLGHLRLSMIVDDLDIMRLALGPTKADAPLIVDPNAPLAHTIPSQRLQMIAGWIAQVLQGQRSIDLPQLPQSALLDIAGKLASPL